MKTKFQYALRLLLPSFAVFFFSSGYAQEEPTKDFKRDIGFNSAIVLNGIFDATSTPFELLYKKYKTSNKATRYGLNLDARISTTDQKSGQFIANYVNESSIFLSPSIGKEFQDRLSDRWVWYYGADAILNFSYYSADFYSGGVNDQKEKRLTAGLSGRPFVGLRFDIGPRLYVAVESSLTASYNVSDIEVSVFRPDEVLSNRVRQSFNLSINPASGIFIFYRF